MKINAARYHDLDPIEMHIADTEGLKHRWASPIDLMHIDGDKTYDGFYFALHYRDTDYSFNVSEITTGMAVYMGEERESQESVVINATSKLKKTKDEWPAVYARAKALLAEKGIRFPVNEFETKAEA